MAHAKYDMFSVIITLIIQYLHLNPLLNVTRALFVCLSIHYSYRQALTKNVCIRVKGCMT